MIFLLIPERFEGSPGAGQWKDLQGIRLVLDRSGLEWLEYYFDGKHIKALADRIGCSASTVIWYYTFWPEAMAELKARCPQARIILRTVNAEALQHWTRAAKDWRRLRGLPRDLYGFFRLLARDRRCARLADSLAGISSWDDARYWRRFSDAGKLHAAPYLSPWPLLKPEVKTLQWEAREKSVVCLAGTRDAIGRGHVEGFAALSRRPEFAGWHFAATAGLLEAPPDDLPEDVERMGCLEDPWELLCKVRAVAVLSPLGSGCKTTVADALAAGCHVLVHPRQHARLPAEERIRTRAVDPSEPASLEDLAQKLSLPPSLTPEEARREQLECALSAWKSVLQ